MSARMDNVRALLDKELLIDVDYHSYMDVDVTAALAEVEEWETDISAWKRLRQRSEGELVAARAEADKWNEIAFVAVARAEAAEAEADRLKAVIAAKDELLVAYRTGSHRKADAALTKLEKLAALAPADRNTE